MFDFDVIVIGAGVAGCSVAYGLAQTGAQVLVLEKHHPMPESIKGELLQPGGLQALGQLGLLDCLEDIDAQPIYGFAVLEGPQHRVLPYPIHTASSQTEKTSSLWQGRAFHHHRFVGKLRERLTHPHITWQMGTVQELLLSGDRVEGIRYRNKNQEEHAVRAPLTIVAGGRSPQLQQQLRLEQQSRKIARSLGVALRHTSLPHPHHGHVFLVHPAPVLGYQISHDTTRLLIDLPQELPVGQNQDILEYIRQHIATQLPHSLQKPLEQALHQGDYQIMQNLVMDPEIPTLDGVLHIGDALSTRHPLTGGGMTVALHDACCLTQLACFNLFQPGPQQNRLIQTFYRNREPLAATVDMLSGALYQIFRSDLPGQSLMRNAVMRYWQMGGMAVEGPMSLLAGLNPNPYQLALHYLAVSLLGMGYPLMAKNQEQSSLTRLRTSLSLGMVAIRTVIPQMRRALRLITH